MTTAKILQFPVGGRAAWTSQRSQPAAFDRELLHAVVMPRTNVASGGAWYHEQAMVEEDTEGKR